MIYPTLLVFERCWVVPPFSYFRQLANWKECRTVLVTKRRTAASVMLLDVSSLNLLANGLRSSVDGSTVERLRGLRMMSEVNNCCLKLESLDLKAKIKRQPSGREYSVGARGKSTSSHARGQSLKLMRCSLAHSRFSFRSCVQFQFLRRYVH